MRDFQLSWKCQKRLSTILRTLWTWMIYQFTQQGRSNAQNRMGWRWCTLKTRSLCLEVFKCKLMCFHRTRPTRMTLASFQLSSYRDKFANSGISKNLLVADIQFQTLENNAQETKGYQDFCKTNDGLLWRQKKCLSLLPLSHLLFFFLFKKKFGGETLKVQFFTSHSIAEPVHSYRRSVVAASQIDPWQQQVR